MPIKTEQGAVLDSYLYAVRVRAYVHYTCSLTLTYDMTLGMVVVAAN
jgi:hypothetical protein